MKRIILSLLLLVFYANSKADYEVYLNVHKIDNIYYRITSDSETERTCNVSYLYYRDWRKRYGEYGTIEHFPFYGKDSINIPSQVTIMGDEFTVTGIDEYTFYKCERIVYVSIPSTVRSIGDYAFQECSALKTIILPDSLESLGVGCFKVSGIESFVLPRKIKSINNSLLYYCRALKQVTLHENLDSIGPNSFTNCSNLHEISIPESVTYIGDQSFWKCVALSEILIPKNVTHLGKHFVQNGYNTSLSAINVDPGNKSYCSIEGVLYDKQKTKLMICPERFEGDLIIPETVTTLDADVFRYCRNIKSVTFPDGLKSIGKHSFRETNIISSISLPKNLESIGDSCFIDSYIPSITIPASTTFIGKNALAGNGFTEIIVDENNPNYSSRDGVFYNKDFSELIIYPRGKAAKSFVVPGQVKTICDDAFAYNPSYETYPSPLETIEIENGVEVIGRDNFVHFTNLKTVSLPASMKEVQYRSFWDCDNLFEVTVYAPTPPIANQSDLADRNRKLHVLPECVDIYKSSSYWSKFGRIIGDAVAGMEGISTDTDNQFRQFFTIDGKPTESMNPGKILVQKSSSGESKKIIVR